MKFTRKVDQDPTTAEVLISYLTEGMDANGVVCATRGTLIVHGDFRIAKVEDMQLFQQALLRCVVHRQYLSANPPIIGVAPNVLTDEQADAEILKLRKPS